MKHIILLRHGQSEWNLANRFTGWTDVGLTGQGRSEADAAGRRILESGILPNFYFTSYLKRAIHTLQIAASAMNRDWIPVIKDWHLNERHYGALQGLDKADTASRYGDRQVHLWRRSYDIAPPSLDPSDDRSPVNDPRYAGIPAGNIPLGESLQDTVERVRPCWEEVIAPRVIIHGTVLIAAHGNSLRALAMMLLQLSAKEIVDVEIPTGKPWMFSLDDRLRVTGEKYL